MQAAEGWWGKLERFVGNASRDFKEILGSEDEEEGVVGETGGGGRKGRVEPGQGGQTQGPVQTAAPTVTRTGTGMGTGYVTEKPVVPGGTGVPVTTAAPTATAGVKPTATTGAATQTTTHGPTTTGA
jgi:hypothetical protein